MEQRLGQGTIVRQEQEPLGVKIQSSYWIEAGESRREQI
jgi:hypothetical protein